MQLLAIRKKSARDNQRLLLANLLHWFVELPPEQTEWLKLPSEREYQTLLHDFIDSTLRNFAPERKMDLIHRPFDSFASPTF